MVLSFSFARIDIGLVNAIKHFSTLVNYIGNDFKILLAQRSQRLSFYIILIIVLPEESLLVIKT